MSHSFDLDVFLPSTPEDCFAACLSADDLSRWFAQHAEVEQRVGGPIRFWGYATLGHPDAASADQTLTAIEPGRRIAFEWTWAGIPSRVEWTFAEGDEPRHGCEPAEAPPPRRGTTMHVHHELDGELPWPRPTQVVEDFWRLATGNLRAHLEGGNNLVLPDFDDPSPRVVVAIEVDAKPATVFRALSEPEILNRWIAKEARVDLRVGGDFDLGWSVDPNATTPCRILALEQDRLLAISWPDWRGQPDIPDQRVTFALEPLDDGARTRVTLTHDGFLRTVDRSDYQQGWVGFLDALAGVARSVE
jgi:uncharacterized protein YndB with AHSA1/START domain